MMGLHLLMTRNVHKWQSYQHSSQTLIKEMTLILSAKYSTLKSKQQVASLDKGMIYIKN